MPDTLDREIRSLVVELIETSPQPRPASTLLLEPRPQAPVTLRAGLVRMALVAVLVLAAGVAGALIGRSLLPLEEVATLPPVENVATQPPVVDGAPAMEPDFSTAELGTEVRLLPAGGEPESDDISPTLDGDVIAVGRIEDTDADVFTWRTLDPSASCLQVISSLGRDTNCSSLPEPSGATVRTPWSVDRNDPDGGPVEVISVWRVPEGTSIVTVEAGGVRVWQRPVAGIAAFTFDPDLTLVTMEALSSDGNSLGGTGISPNKVGNPDPSSAASLEGAAEDFVDLASSHPVNQLLAGGVTSHDFFANAARAHGLNFVCAAGGGLAEWELCLVAVNDSLAVVPFNSETGLVARISHPGLSGDVLVPLDTDQPVGIRYGAAQATIQIEYLGERIGEMTAPSPQDSG